MDKRELLDRYLNLGDESDYAEAKPLYEQTLAERADARLLVDYGYLLYAHARNEIRRALEQYERAIEVDPDYDKAHYHLIGARAALHESEGPVASYEQRLADHPGSVREHRFLAHAYLHAGACEKAHRVVTAGLELAPDDVVLLWARGEAKAWLGDPDGALADWRHAVQLDPEDIGAMYSSAFLLEREGRLAEAAVTWREIIDWSEARGLTLEAVWPKQELHRVSAAIDDAQVHGNGPST
jgi:tetratricopeptide (TPR) repeat protein